MESRLSESLNKLVGRLESWLDTIIVNLPNFILAIIVFLLTYALGRVLKKYAKRGLDKVVKQKSISNLLSNILAIAMIILGIILALSIMNLDTALKSILAGAGVAGLAVGLALQGSLANSFSGIFLAIKDIIQVGDWIESNGYAGKVQEISLRSTKILEGDNNIVVIPNRTVLDNPFKNFSYTKRARVSLACGVAYDSNLRKVKQLVVDSLTERFETDDKSPVEFFYQEFGGSSINFITRFWVEAKTRKEIMHVQSEAILLIKEVFDEHDINIPFPIRTLEFDKSLVEALPN
ncbi:MAG TPA: mechanosensitive ion channel family protein [Saprospiraceae bacterium]|nr:mechanosensitive ion channel family protein [Saprospiraceae bacterium]